MNIKLFIWKKAFLGTIMLSFLALGLVGLAWAQDREDLDLNITNRTDRHLEKKTIEVSDPTAGLKDPLIEAIKAKSEANRKNRLHQADQYNYTKSDIEELLEAGASLEDIYRSDQLGNEWLINPKKLVEEKRANNQSWEHIASDLQMKKEEELSGLLKRHAKAQNTLKNKKMSTAEKIEILLTLEQQGDASLDSAMKVYESRGKRGLDSMKSQGVTR
ncbi:hypothetical protein [Cohnella thermotolerans]|uniref:hypothetical protein n=1 Tax=Cohnella thermotolerans TaxID=329858 RepID=UPI0003F6EC07|nr:hypothetical protein [Cohnella thermotolerans]